MFLICSLFNLSTCHITPPSTSPSKSINGGLVLPALLNTGGCSLVPCDVFPMFSCSLKQLRDLRKCTFVCRDQSSTQQSNLSAGYLQLFLDPKEGDQAGQSLLLFHALPIRLALNLTFHFVSTLRSSTSLLKSSNNIFRSDNDSVKTLFNECGSVLESKLKDKVLRTDGVCRTVARKGQTQIKKKTHAKKIKHKFKKGKKSEK